MDIYAQIWDADINKGTGLKAVFDEKNGRKEDGFVVVNPKAFTKVGNNDQNLRVITKVVIPDKKKKCYDLVRRLFNNYALDDQLKETETPEELQEVEDLMQEMLDSPPMQLAHNYIEKQTNKKISREAWYNHIKDLWFKTYPSGDRPSLSGFEHIVVGERSGSKINGYHFWYKYYLDDGFASEIDGIAVNDRIFYESTKATNGQSSFPETVTISYVWDAPDYEHPERKVRKIKKATGGFFVGCSVEGLLAIGTVRAHPTARAPKETVIDGARYGLTVFLDDSNKYIRTFYPEFRGASGPRPSQPPGPDTHIVEAPFRIVAALVNPKGIDSGKETVTVINTGKKPVSINGWHILTDKSAAPEIITYAKNINPGKSKSITLNNVALSNKGGEILLTDPKGNTIHSVSYSQAQASREGEIIVFS